MIEFIEKIARKAGQKALSHFGKLVKGDISSKEIKNDFVTRIDLEVESLIVQKIHERFADHAIFGEEFGKQGKNADHLWLIDPIDGTTNFIHSHPFFCTSIAYVEKGNFHVAAIYAPYLNELFLAERGQGAFLNGVQIQVSTCEQLSEALLSTGFICLRSGEDSINPEIFKRMLGVCSDIRREGSAALNLAYVAAGRLDGFWEFGLKPYDKAAGILLIREAGGQVQEIGGGSDVLYGKSIATGNEKTLMELQSALSHFTSIAFQKTYT